MHAMTPYLIQSIKGKATNKRDRELFSLSNVNGHDLFEIINKMISKYSSTYFSDELDKRVYKFSKINVDIQNRTISAFLESGAYGVGQPIIDVKSGKVNYAKKPSEANILQHYIQFTIPLGEKNGLALMHKSQGVGVKTMVDRFLRGFFFDQTQHALQILPYAYEGAVKEWLEFANVKSIKAKGYLPSSDPAENMSRFADMNTEFTITPKRKKGFKASLGRLKDYIGANADEEKLGMIAVLSNVSERVQTVAELNGKSKTFETYADGKRVACDIPFGDDEDDVVIKEGQPTFISVKKWSYELANDILASSFTEKAFQLTI